MKPQKQCSTASASPTSTAATFHRQHYCGTCKAIATDYNHSSRLLLNFDTVFLSEILSLIRQEDTTQWEQAFTKVNTCFDMPQTTVPFSLRYAAATNMLLGELKLDDNIKDDKKWTWTIANRYFSKNFGLAKAKLTSWGLDLTTIYYWIDQQAKREKENITEQPLRQGLAYYAEPTATITALLFEGGGQETKTQTELYNLGYAFGELMYILDAFEDYERDVFDQQFNPLWKLLKQPTRNLSESQQQEMQVILWATAEGIQPLLGQLLLEPTLAEQYQSSLTSNLALRIYAPRVAPQTWTERLQLRWQNAKNLANQISCTPTSWIRQLNYYAIVVAVFISPSSSEFLPQQGKAEIVAWSAIITATLASVGLASAAIRKQKKSKKEKKSQRKQERLYKRAFKRLRRIISSSQQQNDCCGSCISSCCESCCDSCCESLCESCSDRSPLFWLMLIMGIIIVTGIVLLILILAGAI